MTIKKKDDKKKRLQNVYMYKQIMKTYAAESERPLSFMGPLNWQVLTALHCSTLILVNCRFKNVIARLAKVIRNASVP